MHDTNSTKSTKIRSQIAEQGKLNRSDISQRADLYFADGSFRLEMSSLWTRKSEAITAFTQEYCNETINDIHVETMSLATGTNVTREAAVQMTMMMCIFPFTAEQEYQWMNRTADLATKSWIANREDQMVETMINYNAGLLECLGADDSDDRAKLIADFRTLNRLSSISFEIMATQRAKLNRLLANESIKRSGSDFADQLARKIQNTLLGSDDLNAKSNAAVKRSENLQETAAVAASTSEQSALAMSDAARTASGLVTALVNIETTLSGSSEYLDKAEGQALQSVEDNRSMSESVTRIDDFLSLIREIADQTNLLALNATIEAARAGDAGRGFAVVAQEVKSLAEQAARVTDEVTQQVSGIRAATEKCVDSTGKVLHTVANLKNIASDMSGNLRTQNESVSAIASAIDETAIAATSMGDLIGQMCSDTHDMSMTIEEMASSALDSNTQIAKLVDEAQEFMSNITAQ